MRRKQEDNQMDGKAQDTFVDLPAMMMENRRMTKELSHYIEILQVVFAEELSDYMPGYFFLKPVFLRVKSLVCT